MSVEHSADTDRPDRHPVDDATGRAGRIPAAPEIDGSTVIARRESRRRFERGGHDPASPPTAPLIEGHAPPSHDTDGAGGAAVPQRVYPPRPSPPSPAARRLSGAGPTAPPALRRRTRARAAPVSAARRDARRLALVLAAAAAPVVVGATLLLILLLPR